MYIQITTKCNMLCAHCCYACTEKGKDMSLKTFKKAIDVLADMDAWTINIGGGEPTVHPHFWDMLGYAITRYSNNERKVWLATNGKKTDDALRLAELARCGIIACDLSQDAYHEPIEDCVVEAFGRVRRSWWGSDRETNDRRNVRNTTDNGRLPIKSGRWANKEGTNLCVCDITFCQTDGRVRQCGCLKSPIIGNVFDGWNLINDEEGCYQHKE